METRNNLQQQTNRNSREVPVPLEPTKENKGKRCEARNYAVFGEDDQKDTDRVCYLLQERLVKAAKNGDLAEVRSALRDGANVEGTYYESFPPLHTAAMFGHSNAVRLLIDNGAIVNRVVSFENTPLLMASVRGHTEVVKILIDDGANVCNEVSGNASEKVAQEKGNREIVELIKNAKAVANCK